ncbi:MAG: hypothetical protein IT337_10990, partial [Thermomicrobiales bacterium]|nr:hypothetical protein [Thermomicrobiales bacterium]
MAYRFLLEVPETLAAEASVAVDRTPDAQVVLVRDSSGLGFEDEFVDLTVAAHTLRVIDSLYDWFDRLGASRPDIRLVLHSGDRVTLEGVDRGAMVATIRRDQPWVERTIPKVGEHEPMYPESPATTPGEPLGTSIDAAGSNAPDVNVDMRSDSGTVAVPEMTRRIVMRGINDIAINVNDMPKAERFYEEFLNLHLEGRARLDADGVYHEVGPGFDWVEAIREGRPADAC